ncbi:MAG: hypothetical protein ACFFB0_07785 [Promethearchaeota archaeon]
MSTKVIDKKLKISGIEENPESKEDYLDISNLFIPFSDVFKNVTPPDIYNGKEMITFKEKDLEFKKILIHEFLNS